MASRGVNKVILIGNLGKDPEIRYFPSGDAVTNFSLATGESWKDKNTGEPQERTEWHRVAIFGKLAEIAKQYLRKGSKVYIEGKLRTRKWQGQDGQDRYTTEVVVDIGGTMQMLDGRSDGVGGSVTAAPAYGGEGAPYEPEQGRATPPGASANPVPTGYQDPAPRALSGGQPGAADPDSVFLDDDIPF